MLPSILTTGRFAIVCLALLVMGAGVSEAGWPCRPGVQRYRGGWNSHCNGHHGLLCARVVQQDCQTYRVTFSGTFFGVVPFIYSTPMSVTGRSADGSVHLHGHSLLPLFGDFDCRATMNNCQFNASYQSESDQGRFNMQRK